MLLSLDVRMDKKDMGATKRCNVIYTILQNGQERHGCCQRVLCYCHKMIEWTRKTWALLKAAMLLTPYYRMDKKDVGATKRCNVVDTRQQNGQERFGGYPKVQCYCHQMLEWTRKTWALLKCTMLLTPYHRIDKKGVGATKRCNVIDTMLQRGQGMDTTKICHVIVMRCQNGEERHGCY